MCSRPSKFKCNSEPGGDYKKVLIIKNVSTKATGIKYRLPDTKYFFMKFPETKKLNPGMNFPVEVWFRPIKKVCVFSFVPNADI